MFAILTAVCRVFFRGATAALQLVTGLMFVVLSFFYLVQSDSGLNVFLNLTGLHFLQDIDNIGFSVASMGLWGKAAKDECEYMMDLKQFIPAKKEKRIWRAKVGFLLSLTLGLLVSWFCFTGKKHRRRARFCGRTLCSGFCRILC
jgi:hypothetical protein